MKGVSPALIAILGLFASAPGAHGGEILHGVYIADHDFVVTVSPVDAESRDAESADLYRREADGRWRHVARCRKITLPDGEVRFVAAVSVAYDGTYEYTSRPVVGGGASAPPEPRSPPKAVVIVDTLPPLAAIVRPEDPASAAAGEMLAIAWTCEDENLADTPGTLSWSPDGGDTWHPVGDKLLPEGEMLWRVPEDASGPAVLRLAAVDRAGNAGTALRQVRIAAKEAPPPAVGETAPPEETPAAGDGPAAAEDRPQRREIGFDRNRSWLYYLMAVNLMRQDNPREALRYYWLSVKEDPNFVDARADIALAYIDIGAYRTARDVALQAREFDPGRVDLMHLVGETYHAEGMDLLGRSQSRADRARAKELIDQAAEWYGRALGEAASEWREAEQAASLYRLGEICYYVNMDPDGARAYWRKILDLHTPAPNPDLVLWTASPDKEKARRRYERQTYFRVTLDTWRNWARGYLEQLDRRERDGIVDLVPPQRVAAPGAGRGDGRSLFSLPADLGSPDPVPAAVGRSASPAAARRDDPARDYSFYAPKNAGRGGAAEISAEPARRPVRSRFSGGPDPVATEPADPYSFPRRGRPEGAWNAAGPYGNEPADDW